MTITICEQAQLAIDAAKKYHKYHWSRYILQSFCRKRKIASNVLRAALQCEAMARAGLTCGKNALTINHLEVRT